MSPDLSTRIRAYAAQLEDDAGHLTLAELEQMLDVEAPVVAAPAPSTARRTRLRWPRWGLAFAGGVILVLVLVGLPLLLVARDRSEPIQSTTTTPTTTLPTVESWQRVGADVMEPAAGLFDVTRLGSGLVAVGFSPVDGRQDGMVFASSDGISWNRRAEADPALTEGTALIFAVTEGGPGLVAVGTGCEDDTAACATHPTVWTSPDGSSWTRSDADAAIFTESGAMLDVVTTGVGIIATGHVSELRDDVLLRRPTVWLSEDGVDWERVWQGDPIDAGKSPFVPGFHALAVDLDGAILGVGTAENTTGELAAAVWVSADGRFWERIDPDLAVFGSQTVMLDITRGEDEFIAVGSEAGIEAALWQSPDGRTWSRIDISDQPFDTTGTLGSVAALDSGYVAAGPHGFADQRGGWVTLWTSTDGSNWDRVEAFGPGYAQSVTVTGASIIVAGGLPEDEDYNASVWAGPVFNPYAPPPDPRPPIPAIPSMPSMPSTEAALEGPPSCDELAASGLSYAEAVVQWVADEMPIEYDPDGNGIPCEAAYPISAVEDVFGGPEALSVRLVSDLPAGLFEASGPAVEAGLMCPAGTTELIDAGTPIRSGAEERWEDRYTCEDGSGSFVLGADIFGYDDDLSFGVWDISSGTGNYAPLAGGGGVVTGSTGANTWSDVSVGGVTIGD